METPAFGTEKEYMDCVLSLENASSSFLDSLREKELKSLSAAKKDRVDEITELVSGADVKFVKDLDLVVSELNTELGNLVKKFQIMRKSYKDDTALKQILGDYNKSPNDSYKKLLELIDAGLNQLNLVVTAYSKIEKEKNPAKKWINTVLSHYSTEQAVMKARTSSRIMKTLESVIVEVRDVCHDSKIELLEIRSKASKKIGQTQDTEQDQ